MAELTTLARPYAKAAFEAAADSGSLKGWSENLALLAAVVSDGDVDAALSSPSLTGEQQAHLLNDLCADEISSQVKNFVSILAENKRLPLLPEIVSLFEILKANKEMKVDVNVASAFPLSDALQEKLAVSLKEKLQREVVLHSKTDKSLIGGAVIRAGDLVIDGSVRGKLGKLAECMNT